jgi:hypothetical protein
MKLVYLVLLIPVSVYAKPASPADVKVAADKKQKNAAHEAIAKAVSGAVEVMPPELSRIVADYAHIRLAPFVVTNNLPADWGAVPSDAKVEIRYAGKLKTLLPGQSINIAQDPDFSLSFFYASDVEYVQIEITYPGPKDSVTNFVGQPTYTVESLMNKAHNYSVELIGDRFPMLLRTDKDL